MSARNTRNGKTIMEEKKTDIEIFAETVQNNEEFKANAKEFIALQHTYAAAIKEITTKLEILDSEFHIKYDHNPIHHIESRLKSAQSIYGKMKKKNLPLSVEEVKNNIFDIAGVRVICNYVNDISRIANLLLKQSDVTLIRMKDYVSNPKPNGYRSLHLVVKVPIFLAESVEYTPVEIQIRTIAMDLWASLEHKLKYKTDENVSKELAARLTVCADQLTAIDKEMQDIYKAINGYDDEEEEE